MMRKSSFLLVALLVAGEHTAIRAVELPPVADRSPVPVTHFPDALHAVVWRNWGLVEPARLAEVLGTTPEKVRELAASMGLPRAAQVPKEMLERGYITIIRRNWHLLPYDQLIRLLGVTPEQLAFTLREDDFLSIKLGSKKPNCEPVKYVEPSQDAKNRAAEIKQAVEEYFGKLLDRPGEPRFGFVAALSKPATDAASARPSITAKIERSPRFIYSYFALFGDPLNDPNLDPYPDGLLQRLRAHGVNGVWLHVVLRQLAPGGPHFPEWGDGHERRLDNLRKLVERAGRYGIDVYLYMNEPRAMPKPFFANRHEMAGVTEGEFTAVCTSDPRVRRWISDSLAHVFREVPGLGGIFTITASENLTNCASHGQHKSCPRCKDRTDAEIIAEVNAVMEEGVHRAAPAAKVIAWDWGWAGHGDASQIIPKLPTTSWLMSVSEWALPIERGGVKSIIGEYSISAVGPGPRATQHWKLAKQHGLKTVAKVQLNNTWELSSVPYLPVMDLVAEHCSRLAQADVDGLMLSWSLGGYPSLNLELAQLFSSRPPPAKNAALHTVAERHFGAAAAVHVRKAWTKFSHALQEFPFHIELAYRGPQQMGPANLLYGAPTGYDSTMCCFPYDDLSGWCGLYSPQVLAGQFEKVAAGWAEGLVALEAAQPLVPEPLQSDAAADLRVAQAAHLHFASVANQARFVMARDALAATTEVTELRRLRQELVSIVDREIDLARRLHVLAAADSRLGYEASNQYYYVPLDLVEKVVNCSQLRQRYATIPLAAADGAEEGFVPLFDGRSLTGWTSAPGAYAVKDGAIVCIAGSSGNLMSEREYADFILRFEFKLTPGANNGLAIRSPLDLTGSVQLSGIELQILDNTAEKYNAIKPYQYHGSVYGVVPAKREGLKPLGEWNEQEVTVVGRHVKVVLNGTTIVDADLDKASTPATIDGQQHPGLKRQKGHIGFLGHGDQVEIRNVQIREIEAK